MFTNFLQKIKTVPIKTWAVSAFVVLMVIAALAAWYNKSPKASSVAFTPAPAIGVAADLHKVDTKLNNGVIKTLPKKELSKKIALPPEVLNDPDEEVTGTGEAPPSETGTQIITTVNTKTGDTTISTKEKEPNLFAFENKYRIGGGYGVSTEGNTAKVFVDWTFARVGNFHVAGQGEINTSTTRGPEAKALAVIYYSLVK